MVIYLNFVLQIFTNCNLTYHTVHTIVSQISLPLAIKKFDKVFENYDYVLILALDHCFDH